MKTKTEAVSQRAGMGTILYDGGTAFRVWAPHASRVFVTGTFNRWSKTETPLASEGNGFWSADVNGAGVGDEYRYILYNSEMELYRTDPYARELTNSVGNTLIVDPAFDWGEDNFQMPPWNELVIYEMHIGSFNVKEEKHPGDFYGVIEKLPYLSDLGINAIEIMPPAEFPGGFSWGYNPAHPFALESDYGGVEAFRAMVKAAHAHGIAVLLDVVYNHFGPSDLDLWRFDGWAENDLGGIYFYNDWRAETPWGQTRPDYGRGEVRQYIRDNALMWLEEFRVDGLRLDATSYIRAVHGSSGGGGPASDELPEGWSLMQWVNQEIQARQPWKITIAEDMANNEWLTKDVGAGGAGFGAQWDPSFVNPIRQAIIPSDDSARDLDSVRNAILHRYGEDAFQRVIYTESHDEVANGRRRIPEEIWPNNVGSWFSKKRSTLGAALALTAPGVPMIFQGQEFLEDRWFQDTDPLEWKRAEQFKGLVQMYRDMICLRRNANQNTRGLCGQNIEVHHLNHDGKVLAFHRWDQGGAGDSVIVVVNLANQAWESYNIGFPAPGDWQVRFNSDASLYDPEFGSLPSLGVTALDGQKDGMAWNGNINLGPYSVLILSQ